MYPILFCQTYAELVEQDERERAQSSHATTIVHLDNGDPRSLVSLGAPAGMSEMQVRAAVQAAVASAQGYDDISKQLVGAGFELIEHITVDVPAAPADNDDLEPEAPR